MIPLPDMDLSGTEQLTHLALKKKAASLLDGDGLAPVKAASKNLAAFDINHDGMITIDDCPFDHGTAQAQLWWEHVVQPAMRFSKSLPEAIPYEQQYHNDFAGFYNGKAIVSHQNVSNNGNIEYMMDKLQVIHGVSQSTASQIVQYLIDSLGSK